MKLAKIPIIVVVGPTASGKTRLSIEIAKIIDGEIICCDSRTVYRGMKIGTSAPSKEEQSGIAHHLLEIRDPKDPLSASQFKELCVDEIRKIKSRGKIPILVGGSGLYIDSVIFDYSYSPIDKHLKESLSGKTIDELKDIIKTRNLTLPINEKNPRHLISTIMNNGREKDHKIIDDCLVLGINTNKEQLIKSIKLRTDKMFEQGLKDEVMQLKKLYGWNIEPMKTIGYMEFNEFFEKKISMSDLRDKINKDTLSYAKRQNTWFKRNKNIHWFDKQSEMVELITTYLNKYSI